MSSRELAFIVLACVFGSAMLGLFLGKALPDRHLDSSSKDTVKLATGLIATLAALVLGLLVSSAKETFDDVNNELIQMSVKIVLLDRVLAQYGPETNELRAGMKSGFSTATEQLLSGDESEQAKFDTPEAGSRLENVTTRIRAPEPQDERERASQHGV